MKPSVQAVLLSIAGKIGVIADEVKLACCPACNISDGAAVPPGRISTAL